MEQRIRRLTRQKVSHFILSEEGKVGSRSTFVASAIVGATSLAAMLLGTVQNVDAHGCPNPNCHNTYCCPLGQNYVCSAVWGPGCWWVW